MKQASIDIEDMLLWKQGWTLDELVDSIEMLWFRKAPQHDALWRPVMEAAISQSHELIRNEKLKTLDTRGHMRACFTTLQSLRGLWRNTK